eukprot:CAMPEP_0206421958 /NCGR_PEP_ID=MMETSP0324_2-20121206/1768_1 /ASSEMBLY_ACC=CAM_ASM_000836 /TAXON_ID=2866 /ORGANISM="Crypthecodinium cohnii, Strain Seligo" /LENGTH=396 /DNA_ID=CAMNT_0053886173 /DNA_START=160 /DNA_END=1350 /DNA_ORIENTATION=-
MSAAVSVGGSLVYEGRYGFADVEAKKPLQGNDLFAIASLTKIFTAVAVLQLVERGLMALEDPIEKFVPEFAAIPGVLEKDGSLSPLQRSVLVVDCLRHTTGFIPSPFIAVLADGRPNEMGHKVHQILEESVDNLDMSRKLAKLPLVNQPGQRIEYGVSVDVAGCLVEVASGVPIDEYLSKHILGPLGMDSTIFVQRLTTELEERVVKCYRANLEAWKADANAFWDDGFEGERMRLCTPKEDYVIAAPKVLRPGASLLSTVEDFMKFGRCLLQGGRLASGEGQILSAESVRLLTKDHSTPECTCRPPLHIVNGATEDPADKGFGLTLCVDKGSSGGGFAEWGGIMTTIFWLDPKRDLVALFFSHIWSSLVYPLRPELQRIVQRNVPEKLPGSREIAG